MSKLHEALKLKKVGGDFGLEIEVEGVNTNPRDPRWVGMADGSLRGVSAEYVFAKPLPRGEVRAALEVLKEELKGKKLDFSFRTSVHVHMNVQQLTLEQYLNTIYTYLLLEEPLLNFCGRERKGNRFCLRLQDAEGLLNDLSRVFTVRGFKELAVIREDEVRYAAMNIAASRKYGSIEFRSMRGTLDIDVLDTWVEALYRIRKFAMKMDSPVDVLKFYMERGPIEFIGSVLGDCAEYYTYPKMLGDIQRSFSLSLDLPYQYEESVANKEMYEKQVVAGVPMLNGLPLDQMAKYYKAAMEVGYGYEEAMGYAENRCKAEMERVVVRRGELVGLFDIGAA